MSGRRFARISRILRGDPRLFDHPYQSPQLPLWEAGEVERHVIIRCESKAPRRKRAVRSFVLQLPLLEKGNGPR